MQQKWILIKLNGIQNDTKRVEVYTDIGPIIGPNIIRCVGPTIGFVAIGFIKNIKFILKCCTIYIIS